MEEKKTKYMDRAINEEILDKLSLINRYTFLNTNLLTVLEQNHMNFLKKAQKFFLRFEITHASSAPVLNVSVIPHIRNKKNR